MVLVVNKSSLSHSVCLRRGLHVLSEVGGELFVVGTSALITVEREVQVPEENCDMRRPCLNLLLPQKKQAEQVPCQVQGEWHHIIDN